MLSWLFFLLVWPFFFYVLLISHHSDLGPPPYKAFLVLSAVGVGISFGFVGMAFSPKSIMSAAKKWRVFNIALLTLPAIVLLPWVFPTGSSVLLIQGAILVLAMIVVAPILWPNFGWFKKIG
jgi:hypothetical protein